MHQLIRIRYIVGFLITEKLHKIVNNKGTWYNYMIPRNKIAVAIQYQLIVVPVRPSGEIHVHGME